MLKKISPDLKIQLYEVTQELAQESSNAWNNAGTGHAGICELSYTPFQNSDGTVERQQSDRDLRTIRAIEAVMGGTRSEPE